MVINIRLELDDSELKAIKSHLAGAPRTSKATRKEISEWLGQYIKMVVANAPEKT